MFYFLIFLLMAVSINSMATGFQNSMSPSGLANIWSQMSPFVYGVVLLIVTALIAKTVRTLLQKMLTKAHLDARVTKLVKSEETLVLSAPIISIVYYAIWLFALPIILTQFGFSSLVGPINDMIQQILGFIPKLFSSLVIFTVFYFAANALRLIISQVLEGIGFNKIMKSIGLGTVTQSISPAKIAGTVVFVMLLLTGATQALQTLGLPMLTDIMNTILTISGNVLFGSMIIALGIWGASVVKGLIIDNVGSHKIASFAQVAIIVFVGLTGIEQMGLQTQIVTTAAQFLMGAVALGFAIAMGMGAKESIGALVSDIIKKITK